MRDAVSCVVDKLGRGQYHLSAISPSIPKKGLHGHPEEHTRPSRNPNQTLLILFGWHKLGLEYAGSPVTVSKDVVGG